MMTAFLAVIGAMLAVLTILNLLFLLAVIRRMRGYEAGGQHSAPTPALPATGLDIAAFHAADLTGTAVTRDDLNDVDLVAFVMPACKPCHTLTTGMRTDPRIDASRTLLLVAGIGQRADELAASVSDLGRVAMLGIDGDVEAAFGGITGFPTLVRVAGGRITTAGRTIDEIARPLTRTAG
jgi:hypothetical protein